MAGGPSAVPNHAAERSQPAEPSSKHGKQRCPGGCGCDSKRKPTGRCSETCWPSPIHTDPPAPSAKPAKQVGFLDQSRGPIMCKWRQPQAGRPHAGYMLPKDDKLGTASTELDPMEHIPHPSFAVIPAARAALVKHSFLWLADVVGSNTLDKAPGKGVAEGACMLLFMLRSGFDHSQPLSNIRL